MFAKNFFKFKWITRETHHLAREIIVNAEKLETRVAVLENGRLEEFQVEHGGSPLCPRDARNGRQYAIAPPRPQLRLTRGRADW